MAMNKDDFFAANKRRFKDVALPGGGSARIRSLTAGEWADIDARNTDAKNGGLSVAGMKNSDRRLIVASVVDADGNPIFAESDIPKLGELDSGMTIPLVRAIREHTGLKGDVEDALKNSEATTGGSSPTSS
jgi:hypothetical protein